MYTLVGYKPCSTCRAIEKSLKNLNLPYQYREITQDIPNADELWHWYQISGENSVKKLMNTSGTLYRDLDMKTQLKDLTEKEQLKVISQNGMLIKRPILLTPQGKVYIGKRVVEYLKNLQNRKESQP